MDEYQAELERLRARVRELEALDLRVEHAHAMARQLRAQADAIVRSRTWRILSGGGGFWQRIARKMRRPTGPAITPAQYHQWIADCERREVPGWDGGPQITVVARGERTLRSLGAQTYRQWDVTETLSAASGDYVVLVAENDELAPDALYLFARAAAEGADLVYCDEDRLDDGGVRVDPWFKPDWSPDLFAATNYVGRAMAARRNLVCGALDETPARARQIVHVPRVLYHRRAAEETVVRRVSHAVPAGTRVEILIPSRSAALLARCLRNLKEKTAWTGYTLTIIDNSGGDEIAGIARSYAARYVDCRQLPFNYSEMNNRAAAASNADLLLFLNDDTIAIDPGWLEAMIEHGVRPEVGAVGARLMYPDGTIQHAGVAIGIFGVCGHVFKGWPGDLPTYRGMGETVRNVAAVTGACMLVPAPVFRRMGGFDPRTFPVAYNDIDLCLRILDSGLRVIYTPYARLYHDEARSKPWSQRDPARAEVRAFQERWTRYIEHDPFYNPNLTRAGETFGLRRWDEWI